MKILIIAMLAIFSYLAEASSEDSLLCKKLIGKWTLDVKKTRANRALLKKNGIPSYSGGPISFKINYEDIRETTSRILIYDEHSISGVTSHSLASPYKIIQTEGTAILLFVEYTNTNGGKTPLYIWWEFVGPNEAVHYCPVYSSEPMSLDSVKKKGVVNYYKRNTG